MSIPFKQALPIVGNDNKRKNKLKLVHTWSRKLVLSFVSTFRSFLLFVDLYNKYRVLANDYAEMQTNQNKINSELR